MTITTKFHIPFFIVAAILSFSLQAASVLGEKDFIWKKDQNVFIKYEDLDTGRYGANDHPTELKASQIKRVLGSLQLEGKHLDPVFSLRQLDVLSRFLVIGLKNARPDQDIIFVLEKEVKRGFKLQPDHYFITGRIFYKEDRLNIIFGSHNFLRHPGYEAVNDPTNVGVNKYAFKFGDRDSNKKVFRERVFAVNGVEKKVLDKKTRNNWFVIDLNAAAQDIVKRRETRRSDELVRKRRELQRILGSGVVPAPAVQRTPEERLRSLQGLLDKGLISQKEYDRKRQQILDSL